MRFYVGMSVDAFGGAGCTADLVDTPCDLVYTMLQAGQALFFCTFCGIRSNLRFRVTDTIVVSTLKPAALGG